MWLNTGWLRLWHWMRCGLWLLLRWLWLNVCRLLLQLRLRLRWLIYPICRVRLRTLRLHLWLLLALRLHLWWLQRLLNATGLPGCRL